MVKIHNSWTNDKMEITGNIIIRSDQVLFACQCSIEFGILLGHPRKQSSLLQDSV